MFWLQYLRDLVSAHFQQHLVLSLFFIWVILMDVLFVVLIQISLVANDVEHLFMCLFAFYRFSLVKCLLMFAYFWLDSLLFHWQGHRDRHFCWKSVLFSHVVGYAWHQNWPRPEMVDKLGQWGCAPPHCGPAVSWRLSNLWMVSSACGCRGGGMLGHRLVVRMEF